MSTIHRWSKREDWRAAAEAYDAGVGAAALAEGQSLYRDLLRRFNLAEDFEVEDVKDAIMLLGKLGAQVPKGAQAVSAEISMSMSDAERTALAAAIKELGDAGDEAGDA